MEKVTIEIDDKYADAFQFTCIGGLGSKSVNISNGVYVLRNGTNFVVDSKGSPRQDRIPAVDAAPVKHGKWIYWPGWVGNHDKRIDDATCSICGFKHPTVLNVKTPKDCLYKYCPECGAKMDLED